jgi:16S rRNA (guanine966-N2)-methyltransferase
MRITGGSRKNRSLRVHQSVRPTGGRIREALFSIWSRQVGGARFLDLFAGSGSVGLEALSRGASYAVFVERSGPQLGFLEANCRDFGDECWAIRKRRLAFATAPEGDRCARHGLAGVLQDDLMQGGFDLVFADPPYEFDTWDLLLSEIESTLASRAEVAIEHSSRSTLPSRSDQLLVKKTRTYGESSITFYTLGSSSET